MILNGRPLADCSIDELEQEHDRLQSLESRTPLNTYQERRLSAVQHELEAKMKASVDEVQWS